MNTNKHHEIKQLDDEQDRWVSMSNILTRAAHSLNLSEKRLIALGLASTDSVPLKSLALAGNSGWKVRVTAQEYAATFDVEPCTAYTQMQEASRKLFSRQITSHIKNRKGKPTERNIRWVSSALYADGDGYVELNFSPEIAPHLLGLRKQFTTYKLRHAAALDTVYAWRLFEMLKSWQSTGLYATTIEDFWEAMEAPPSCRKDFKALRIRIIEPAVESITAKASMLVEWTPVKSGARRVTSLEFRFEANPQHGIEYSEDGTLDSSEVD